MFGIKKIAKELRKVINDNFDKSYNISLINQRNIEAVEKKVEENNKYLMDWVLNMNERVDGISGIAQTNYKDIAELREFEKRVNRDYEKFIGEHIKMFLADIDGIKEDIWRLKNPPAYKAGDIVLLGRFIKEEFTVLEVIPKRYEKNSPNIGFEVELDWVYKIINNKTKQTSTLLNGMLN